MRKLVLNLSTLAVSIILISMISGCSGKSPKTSNTDENSDKEQKFRFVEIPAEKRVEVWIGDDLFTSYMYPGNIAKPVLYPLTTSSGKVLTRAYPLDTIPGERVDHPHHVGHWMNYGDVNGLDFWNNSEAIPVEKRDGYGTIFHKEVLKMEGGEDSGVLEVATEWKAPDGTVLLEEHTKFVFSEQGATRIIDRTTTLKALDKERQRP